MYLRFIVLGTWNRLGFLFCEKKLLPFLRDTTRSDSGGRAGPSKYAAGGHERGTRDRTAAVLAGRPTDPEHRRYSQRTSFLRDKCAYKRSTRYARGEIAYASLFPSLFSAIRWPLTFNWIFKQDLCARGWRPPSSLFLFFSSRRTTRPPVVDVRVHGPSWRDRQVKTTTTVKKRQVTIKQ